MHTTIQARLHEITQQHDVKIIHAVESGSRAWGFPSTDSDFDVRFIYAHRPEWYLAVDLESKRDVIEYPVDNELDITGWDLRKALGLLHKSNPPLLEWLSSPIVYATDPANFGPMLDLAPAFFAPVSCMYHYRSVAQSRYVAYTQDGNHSLKKFFYSLRSALAYTWIDQDRGIVPMPFVDLVAAVVPSPQLKQQIAQLVEVKRTVREADGGAQMAALEAYLEDLLREMDRPTGPIPPRAGTMEMLNDYFRGTLAALW